MTAENTGSSFWNDTSEGSSSVYSDSMPTAQNVLIVKTRPSAR